MKVVAWVVGLALAAAGVLVLRAEVMTVNEVGPPGSRTAFVVQAQTREHPRHLEEMTRSLVSVCRLLVNSDLLAASFARLDGDEFAFSLAPGLDEFDLREMRGCLQDTKVQHLLVEVTEVQHVGPGASA